MFSRLGIFLTLALAIVLLLLLRSARPPISHLPSAPVASNAPASRGEGKGIKATRTQINGDQPQSPGQRIFSLLEDEESAYKLSPSELAMYVESNRSNSFSLVAAYETSRNQDYIKLAARLHPDDPLVQSKILLHNVFPEERQKWIDAFKKRAPENSLGNFMAARELLNKGDVNGALSEIASADGKKFDDYFRETATGLQEAYLEAGRPVAEAKVIGSAEVLLPHLAQLKRTAADLRERAVIAGQQGDLDSQKMYLSGAYSMASHLRDFGKNSVIITELVGVAMENDVLRNWPSGEPVPFLQALPEEQLRFNADRRTEIKRNTQILDPWLRQAREEEIIAFQDRMTQYGESQALVWLRNKYPELRGPKE
ncbi:MAG: hypothetical protein ACO1QB_15785 [Verrucomicrobiales bacterium]